MKIKQTVGETASVGTDTNSLYRKCEINPLIAVAVCIGISFLLAYVVRSKAVRSINHVIVK